VDVEVPSGTVLLPGHLTVPEAPGGTIVFAHGSGSGRHSPRNRFVAFTLSRAGLATLLLDLLTADEELDRGNVFDVPLLTQRLDDATRWVESRPELRSTPVGYFGASTGAGAALRAAARPGSGVSAVVSRGGRPDLAGTALAAIRAPTLLIVGERDEQVLELNKLAQSHLRCPNELAVVPGATHLFEEPGALESVAELARGWFVRYLTGSAPHHGNRAEPS
jgi:putative phosphoribosyl transferase